ncbi:hypothetical protein PIB30_049268 [Stylosanthes scabra]|uniref:Uncharacterized protein n=1 Tax=Stylosanthes scabra TaxID=79078 RepID=A0ABU6WK00_9FABA|nr:hypothetical protein [Stylosanthes scabra]
MAEAGVRDMRRRSKASRSGAWDTKANPSKARTNSSWGNNNNKVDSKVRDDVTLVEDTWSHKSENTNVSQSKEIESSWDAKKLVENSSLVLPVPSGMCVSKSHRQPLTGSSSMEDAASTTRHADVAPLPSFVLNPTLPHAATGTLSRPVVQGSKGPRFTVEEQ